MPASALHDFLLAFIPLFVAIDPIGLVPIYIGLVSGVAKEQQAEIAYHAIGTSLVVALGFVFLGRSIFIALGITQADFEIAGGLILFGLAVSELLFADSRTHYVGQGLGVVPVGMPLIAGPATLTTLLVLVDSVGIPITLSALAANLALLFPTLLCAQRLRRIFGLTVMRALSRIVALLLAAIAIHMIRRGLYVGS